jgi:hypothetical protein
MTYAEHAQARRERRSRLKVAQQNAAYRAALEALPPATRKAHPGEEPLVMERAK